MTSPSGSRSSLLARLGALVLLGGLGVAPSARAQELAYCDLSVTQQNTKLQLNGATVMAAGARKGQGIVVTPELANQRSTVFHSVPIDFAPGESLYQHFRVRISGGGADAPPNGADGFAFMVQNDPGGDPLGEGKTGAGVTAVGRAGEGFGYAGITRSVALELDTFQNAVRLDPNGNHIAFDLGGHTYHTTTGAAGGTTLAGQAEGSTVATFQPVNLNVLTHSLESTTASFDTRDVWIDYVCVAGACSAKVYMTFNNALLAAQFADPAVPASVPTKPATPILTVNGLQDLTQYLGGASGYAGFSASTGGNMDQHLVTYWVLSKTPFSDSNTNHVEDLCDCRNVPGACSGNIPICDLTTPQGYCRDCQSNAECAGKDPTKPVCDSVATGGSGACVECTSSANCAAAKPNCDTGTSTCTAKCTIDTQCPAAQWCSNPTGAVLAGTCVAKLPNGTVIPTTTNHAPVLNGTCTGPVGASVCASGVCDTADNKCGLALGDGTCTVLTQCRAGVCVTTGTNTGKCEPCLADATCGGVTPVCNVATNQCVQCTAGNSAACTGGTPICNVGTHLCGPCNGNSGSGASAACPAGAPFCTLATGACSTACTSDAQCGAGNWCNDVTLAGTCAPKQVNGTPVPGGACTPALGGRACLSAVCDAADARCGYAEGDGPCAAVAQCRAGACVTSGVNATKCEPCQADGSCAGATPACNPATNHCVQCTITNGAACVTPTPFCDTASSTCAGCTSDLGVASLHPCLLAGAAYCAPGGGGCGKCATNADCALGTHSGPYCIAGTCSPTCATDADCGGAAWCDAAGVCDPKVPNGSPLPATPPIGGSCTVTNGERVCVSAVCDPADDKCGLGNGALPPNDGGRPECRSGVVGLDGKCGYPNGEGPCSASNGAKVCRSGACNAADGVCGVDNGLPPPNDGGSPECRSGVVGSDGKCGYPNGEGPCTQTTGPVVCRSGTCDPLAVGAGKCIGPVVDAGTPEGDASVAPPKKDAGSPHVDASLPPLTCPNGVVGSDGKCGYPNGEGPCTPADVTVCRSGACNAADSKCGYPVGTGTCSDGTVCRSSTCDATGVCGCATDGECGTVTGGRVCGDAHTCTDGCRGTGGNGCPDGTLCSSATASVGVCGTTPPIVTTKPTDSLAGGGCACGVPSRGGRESPAGLFALGVAVAAALSRRRKRSGAARGPSAD